MLVRGEKSGELRAGIDPMQLYISIAGLAYFYLSNNHTLATIFGRELMTPKAQAARLEHMCAVIVGYVAQPVAPAATSRRNPIRLSPDNALRRPR